MLTFSEYVDRKQAENIEFCEDRKKGASKIATEAKGKGAGPAQLTAWHFAAKLPEYDDCIKAIKEKKPASYFHEQELSFIRQIASVKNQRKFQELMGKAEVWGEVFIKLNA
jgi:hypothetical protein